MTQLIWPSAKSAIANAKRTVVAPLKWNPTDHLLSRFAFGPTVASRKYIADHGVDAWFKAQLTSGTTYAGYNGNTKVAAVGSLLGLSPFDIATRVENDGVDSWAAMNQLTQVTIGLQAWSKAQLYEVMVDFFSNHLNVANHRDDQWNVRHAYDRDVIRKHALGSFTDMLLASSKHPAMLKCLNLAESTKIHVNENYGRELLELHTVGLEYTEGDVVDAARLLTGRTVDEHDHYLYDDYIHPTGAVKVLGFTHANDDATAGEAVGDSLLRYLAGHTSTATRLAQKLCVRLVSDTPSAALVQAVANAYLENDTRIVPMIKTIFRSTEFWESRGQKVRRPAENVIATVRILGMVPRDWTKALADLQWITDRLGHQPLEWPAPNGYPDVAGAWRSAGMLMRLWHVHAGLAGAWYQSLTLPTLKPLLGTPATSGAAIKSLTTSITGTKWTSAHLTALQTFMGEPASTAIAQSRMQWLRDPLIGLILDSPQFALR